MPAVPRHRQAKARGHHGGARCGAAHGHAALDHLGAAAASVGIHAKLRATHARHRARGGNPEAPLALGQRRHLRLDAALLQAQPLVRRARSALARHAFQAQPAAGRELQARAIGQFDGGIALCPRIELCAGAQLGAGLQRNALAAHLARNSGQPRHLRLRAQQPLGNAQPPPRRHAPRLGNAVQGLQLRPVAGTRQQALRYARQRVARPGGVDVVVARQRTRRRARRAGEQRHGEQGAKNRGTVSGLRRHGWSNG